MDRWPCAVTTTFHEPPLAIAALILLCAAFENLSLIFLVAFAPIDVRGPLDVQRLGENP